MIGGVMGATHDAPVLIHNIAQGHYLAALGSGVMLGVDAASAIPGVGAVSAAFDAARATDGIVEASASGARAGMVLNSARTVRAAGRAIRGAHGFAAGHELASNAGLVTRATRSTQTFIAKPGWGIKHTADGKAVDRYAMRVVKASTSLQGGLSLAVYGETLPPLVDQAAHGNWDAMGWAGAFMRGLGMGTSGMLSALGEEANTATREAARTPRPDPVPVFADPSYGWAALVEPRK
jgi:hypothetical protein